MTLSESVVLYDSCHDIATRLRGRLLRLLDKAEATGHTVRTQELKTQFAKVTDDLNSINPDDEDQMRDCMAKWSEQIRGGEATISA